MRNLIILFFFTSSVFAQSKVIQVVNQKENSPIPFVIVRTDSLLFQSNIEGYIYLNDVSGKTLLLTHPFYHSLDTVLLGTNTNDTIILPLQYQPPSDVEKSDAKALEIIDSTLLHAPIHNIYHKKTFKYFSYNKARITSNTLDEAKNLLSKLLDLFAVKLQSFDGSHHILLAESVTKREYANKFNDKEYIVASRISGVEKPKMLALNSQVQSISIYERFIKVIDKSYVSPLFKGAEKRYNFQLIEVIRREKDDLYVIQFSPNGKLKQVLLSGVLYISSNQWAVESAIIRPDKASTVDFDVYFKYAYKNKAWIPLAYSTHISLSNLSSKNFQFATRYSTYIYDFEFNVPIKKDFWNDVAIEFLPQDSVKARELIIKNRREEFSKKDKRTFTFYQTIGSVKNIDRAFDFAEHLYNKEIKMKHFNIDLNRAFDYNKQEGFRLGIGANKYLDKKKNLKVGGHMAYGLKDNEAKFGVKGRYKLLPLKKLTIFGGLEKETYEVAQNDYSFYRHQYSTEWLRQLSVSTMDVSQRAYIGFETSPIKYTSLSFKLTSSKNHTPYTYQYKENTSKTYRYSDLELGLRFAFGETHFKLKDNKYRLKTHYPILWTKLNFGLTDFLGGNYNYVKIDSRIEYTMRSFLLGSGRVQFNFGHAIGDLPYFTLFEGYGAQKAIVSKNGFETMRINEFLSSTYANMFLTYEITKLYFRKRPKYRPSIELHYNTGIGMLQHKKDHKELDFKTMEKSYHEAGLSIRDIVAIKIYATRIGLGLSNFLRFGPYAHENFKDNYNAKAFITFSF